MKGECSGTDCRQGMETKAEYSACCVSVPSPPLSQHALPLSPNIPSTLFVSTFCMQSRTLTSFLPSLPYLFFHSKELLFFILIQSSFFLHLPVLQCPNFRFSSLIYFKMFSFPYSAVPLLSISFLYFNPLILFKNFCLHHLIIFSPTCLTYFSFGGFFYHTTNALFINNQRPPNFFKPHSFPFLIYSTLHINHLFRPLLKRTNPLVECSLQLKIWRWNSNTNLISVSYQCPSLSSNEETGKI